MPHSSCRASALARQPRAGMQTLMRGRLAATPGLERQRVLRRQWRAKMGSCQAPRTARRRGRLQGRAARACRAAQTTHAPAQVGACAVIEIPPPETRFGTATALARAGHGRSSCPGGAHGAQDARRGGVYRNGMSCTGARRGVGSSARRAQGGTAAKRGRGRTGTAGRKRGQRFQASGSDSEDAGEADDDADEDYGGGTRSGRGAAARKRLEPMLVADEDFLK